VLSNLNVGTIIRVHLDKPHPTFVHAEIVLGSPGVPLPPGLSIGSKGWVSKSAIVMATVLTASFGYDANGSDECSFKENDKVYGFKEMDGWWDGFSTTAGMFPANYVTLDAVQPTFAAVVMPAVRAAPPSFSSAATATLVKNEPPPPSYDNPLMKQDPKFASAMGMGSATAVPLKKDIVAAAPAPRDAPEGKFKGKKPQQYALWARNLGVGASFVIFWCGVFTVYWATDAK
jgi:hypothetical protein